MSSPATPPGFEELRDRVSRAYEDFGGEVTRWGLAAGKSRPGDAMLTRLSAGTSSTGVRRGTRRRSPHP